MVRDCRGVADENHKMNVERDKAEIDKCWIILVNYSRPSVGTSIEILYAWEWGKYIVLICAKKEISHCLVNHSHKICGSLPDAGGDSYPIAAKKAQEIEVR